MNRIASYSCVSTPGVNQVSKMQPDEDGYYKCIVGAFNCENSSGIPYPLTESVRSLFAEGGIVRRRLDKGVCRGEYAHPDINNMQPPDIIRRLAKIDENQVSHHIRSIELVSGKNEYNRDIVLSVASLRPCGPKGPFLKESLDNPHENVAFSIRSFTRPMMMGGKMARIVTDAITYDYVNEGGILPATQFNTAISLEELVEDIFFTEEDFDMAVLQTHTQGLEAEESTISMIRTALGWQQVQTVNVLSWI